MVSKPGGGLGGADGSTRIRRVVNSDDTINSEGGRTRRRQGNVTLMWFVSFSWVKRMISAFSYI